MSKVYLLNLNQAELETYLADFGQPKFRAKQVWQWLYQHHAANFSEMSNLPKALRAQLNQHAQIDPLTITAQMESTDGHTTKTLFALPDGEQIEAVLMRYEKRRTLCISSQAGCAMDCPFCATGQMGFRRNLAAGEIMAQVLHYARLLDKSDERVSNIVFMGMGEPLANYRETWEAARRLNHSEGFNLGARNITISTVGVVPAIRRMSQESEQIGLAVSLHAPSDDLRDQLVPLNKRYPLDMLMKTCRDYIEATHRRITFEYALMDGWNDSDSQAEQLADLLQGMLCHINLIPLNPTPNSPYGGSPDERVYTFRDILQGRGISTTVRIRRGIDIQAGCGQLHAAQANG